jgi:serine/threonine-protein kinase
MAESAVSAGHVLVGRYRLESQLGAGGMGTIWRAQHLVLNAPVAVKVIDRTVVPDEETLSRFMREAQAAAALRSPHVVQILDYGIDGKVPFMAMELLEGENLAQRLKRVKRLSARETFRIMLHIGRAIGRAHDAGIVHRDLKPENVFLVRNEDEEVAKVLDFGVAKVSGGALGEATHTRTGSILGTPFYMSPEQAQGNRTVDARSDLWSMGVIAFECITGTRPFYSDGLGDLVLAICVRDIPVPSEICKVPIGFDGWWQRAVARDPEKRFHTAKDLVEGLRDALGIESTRDSSRSLPEIEVSRQRDTDRDRPPPGAAPFEPFPQRRRSLSDSPPPFSDALTIRADEPGQETAATVAVSPNNDMVALTERQFGTTQRSQPAAPSRSSGLGLIVGVAAVALTVGLAMGVIMLRRGAAEPPDPNRALPAPLPAAETERDAKLKAKPEPDSPAPASASPASASAPLLEFLPSEADELETPGAAAPASSAAKAPSVAEPAPASPHGAASAEGSDNWVKPSWAIPDEEPVRATPIDE